MGEDDMKIVKEAIASYPDFPKPGIVFRDIFPVMKEPKVLKKLLNYFEEQIKTLCPDVSVIVGLDSRGFLFAPYLSLTFDVPFVPIRKKGKLPGKTESVSFKLEYGDDTFEIQQDSISPGNKVVIIDDLLATGGTMRAAVDLITKLGGTVSACLVAIELSELEARGKIKAPIHSAVKY